MFLLPHKDVDKTGILPLNQKKNNSNIQTKQCLYVVGYLAESKVKDTKTKKPKTETLLMQDQNRDT